MTDELQELIGSWFNMHETLNPALKNVKNLTYFDGAVDGYNDAAVELQNALAEPLLWNTVELHGRPPTNSSALVWELGKTPRVVREPGAFTYEAYTRWVSLSALCGQEDLPGWDSVAPAPKPEFPWPWLGPNAVSNEDPSNLIGYAWAVNANDGVLLKRIRPTQLNTSVVAWCPLKEGHIIPAHPYNMQEDK